MLSREELLALVEMQAQRIAALEQELDLLRSQLRGRGPGNALPPFVKPNAKKPKGGEKKIRKKRSEAFTRKREEPTKVEVRAVEQCPDCGRKLSGGWEHYRRQVIEIPEAPVEVIEYVLMRRWCGICKKMHVARLGAADGVVGQHRVGPRLMSLVATLATQCRMPHETIQGFLQGQYGLHLSVGEISEILHAVAKAGMEIAAAVLEEVRTAPVVHGDETGWREDGDNGYLWSFSTARARYYYRDPSRKGQVARDILGEGFIGVLVCDFYAGYSWYPGRIQRCWVHLCGDLKELKEAHSQEKAVVDWVDAVLDVYHRAKLAARQEHSASARRHLRCAFEAELLAIARPYLEDKEAPQHRLAKRIEKHQSELFVFVEYPEVPSENNAAERAVRPAVIARKISGGTRSAKGSATKGILMTLFGTWILRGSDCFRECIAMLLTPPTAAATAPT